jgi:Flp pilus assembly protein protease CpaA
VVVTALGSWMGGGGSWFFAAICCFRNIRNVIEFSFETALFVGLKGCAVDENDKRLFNTL